MSLTDQLKALEAELHHPGSAATVERLNELLHPEFFEVGRSGQKYDRNTVIQFLLKAATEQKPYAVEAWSYQAIRLDNNSALLTYSSKHVLADGSVAHSAHRSSIWRLAGEGWQLFYHQGTAFD